MQIKHFEEKISSDLKWNTVGEIPDFPLNTFEDVKNRVGAKEYTVGIDFTTSNQLAEWLYGRGYHYFYLLLASTPIIVCIISLVLAFTLKNYWLLAGIFLGFSGQLMSNPYNPSKQIWKSINFLLFLVFAYSVFWGKDTLAYLLAFFVFPFFINSSLYRMNQNKLKKVALDSENIFIYLYQIGKLGLKDNSSQVTHWYR
jgi:hypothetical protein